MSRFTESQWPEMQERIERLERCNWRLQHEVTDLKRSDDTVREIRIVELAYSDKCKCGMMEINKLLAENFDLYKQFQTENGVVVELARWGLK